MSAVSFSLHENLLKVNKFVGAERKMMVARGPGRGKQSSLRVEPSVLKINGLWWHL